MSWGLGAYDEADLARWVGWNCGEPILCDCEKLTGSLPEFVDEREVEPETLCLGGDVTTWSEGCVKKLKVGFLEQRFSGPNRVGGIGDDGIVC